MISVYVTFPSQKAAQALARKVVAERLLACANLFPITSIYRWKSKLVEAKEWAMIGKCDKGKLRQVEKRILELHPYKVPCIVWHEEKATPKYAAWVRETGRR
ncbi:Divalent-cation tolerance protein CutA [Candidatus Burarchaeum australiense]|nr:Divalent-cation tolerance protein CutA [Candidatus Burarchaeum australiense]